VAWFGVLYVVSVPPIFQSCWFLRPTIIPYCTQSKICTRYSTLTPTLLYLPKLTSADVTSLTIMVHFLCRISLFVPLLHLQCGRYRLYSVHCPTCLLHFHTRQFILPTFPDLQPSWSRLKSRSSRVISLVCVSSLVQNLRVSLYQFCILKE
jgi:hypothetical protein